MIGDSDAPEELEEDVTLSLLPLLFVKRVWNASNGESMSLERKGSSAALYPSCSALGSMPVVCRPMFSMSMSMGNVAKSMSNCGCCCCCCSFLSCGSGGQSADRSDQEGGLVLSSMSEFWLSFSRRLSGSDGSNPKSGKRCSSSLELFVVVVEEEGVGEAIIIK